MRAPADVFLSRAQLLFMAATLIPTILTVVIGILLLVIGGSRSVAVFAGVLVLALGTSSITGYILGTIFVTRGAALARVQNEFLAAVSHELRTPLTSMRMFIDTLREERVNDPVERRRCLTVIHEEMNRLDGLVGRLIELSKIESSRHAFDKRPVAVADVIDDALVAFEAIRFGSRVDLSVIVPRDLTVYGDRSALAQAVTNLLANAWKYTPEADKRIEVSAQSEGRRVALEVSDNGPGVPRDEQRLIFEKFERGRAAEGRSGSGLGLAIVRAVTRAHGGKVDVRPGATGGARFRIILPRWKGAA